MASRNEMEMLAGKALMEDSFRARLQKDPIGAAGAVGVKLTDADVGQLKNVDWAALDKLASDVQAAVKAPTLMWGG